MMGWSRTWLGLGALAAVLGLASAPAVAEGLAVDPLALLPPVAESELAELHGRQGLTVLLNRQTLVGTVDGNEMSAGGDISAGNNLFNDSFNSWRGFNNVGTNSGNQSTVVNGQTININVH